MLKLTLLFLIRLHSAMFIEFNTHFWNLHCFTIPFQFDVAINSTYTKKKINETSNKNTKYSRNSPWRKLQMRQKNTSAAQKGKGKKWTKRRVKKWSWVSSFVGHIKDNWKSITCDKILPCHHDAGPSEANLSYSVPRKTFFVAHCWASKNSSSFITVVALPRLARLTRCRRVEAPALGQRPTRASSGNTNK